MKELATLLNDNPEFLSEAPAAKKIRKTRHLIFSSRDGDDRITITLCGKTSNKAVRTRKLPGVDCADCLQRIIDLAEMDSHADALEYVRGYAPKILNPNKDKMKQRHAEQPTKMAEKHIDAQNFLDDHSLKTPADLPGNIIGSTEATYYYNMVELNLIDGDVDGDPGKPMQDTIDKLQSAITSPEAEEA